MSTNPPPAEAPQLPNPLTPLAFLPPTLASQYEVARYLLAATCGMFAWDVLLNLANDYKLIARYPIRLPTIVYFVSKIATFAFIITSTVFTIGAVGDCQKLQVAIGSCFAVAGPMTSLLFFLRVKAIFNHSLFISVFFGIIWLATLAGSITVPFAITGSHIGPTDHCINTGVKAFSSTGVISSTVNDTLVFVFISYRLLADIETDMTLRERFALFIQGKGLPALTRAVLQSGQQYYMFTVGGNLLSLGLILAPTSLPAVFHAMANVPNLAVSNSMACRVFREIRFGHILEPSTAGATSYKAASAINFRREIAHRNESETLNLSTFDATPPGATSEISFRPTPAKHDDIAHVV
ncbi:hypothetical protein E1B28_003106 [Marasmius oreades]|uniref:Transmembrane protein n=1 Tax=Marasmius oreades TaxID=181124 RepID=A0A9P7UN32_9AGAR|nr:uncharacterized protein E1B28_003106 [Marasmius oreades]KAG7085549.1 hypothetical protein E1B28_003106 [Marasmius oreades]